MSLCKISYSLVVAGLLSFSNLTYAAVYDFGNLLTSSSGYTSPKIFSHLAATDNGGGILTFNLGIKNNLFSSLGNNEFTGSRSFYFTPNPGRIGSTGLHGLTDFQGVDGFDSAKCTPITAPVPEPETYAMILAGIGLIGFTARRRKRNT